MRGLARSFAASFVAAVLLTTSVAGTASAEHVPDEWCLGTPTVSETHSFFEGTLSDTPLQVPIRVRLVTDSPFEICTGMTAIVQKADGSHRTVVPLDRNADSSLASGNYVPEYTD